MNIQTVAQNLRNTIAGKEKHLVSLNGVLAGHHLTPTERTVCGTTAKFLEVNLDELRRILKDVEQCIEKDVYNSWRDDPDRMGGQFADEEVRRAGEWR